MTESNYLPLVLDDLSASYDYIVVGAGAAGSVVAGRLSAQPGLRVRLVETGGAGAQERVGDPNQWPTTLGSPLDWSFFAEPNPALNGRSIFYSMGKALGGGTAINVSTWSRGHRREWDSFAEAAGDPRWSYASVLDLYRNKIEDW